MKCIVQRRRQQTGRHDWELGELSKGEARELWHDIDVLRSIDAQRDMAPRQDTHRVVR